MHGPRPIVVLLVLAFAAATIRVPIAVGSQIESPFPSSDFALEVVAATDSKGRVHAAWVEQMSYGLTNATLWYSSYDPEFTSSKTARRVDSSASIYSVSMAIDDADNVHMVWVRDLTDTIETVKRTEDVGTKPSPSAVCYSSTSSEGTAMAPSRLLLESQAESLWASIAAGYRSQLYLAWVEVVRSDLADLESRVYYTQLNVSGIVANVTPTLVSRAPGSSKLLKATASADRHDLHLAWYEETPATLPRVVHSEVDLTRSFARIVDTEDVDGRISRLTMGSTRNGEVVVGWVYQESAESGLMTRAMRYSPGKNATSTTVRIALSNPEKLESFTVDSEGNLEIVWMYVSEDVRAGSRPVAATQQSFCLAELGSDGRLSEEKTDVPFMPAVAAFVVANDELYFVSREGTVEAAKPVSASNALFLLLGLALFTSFLGGMSTEPGTYLIATWMRRRHVAGDAPANSSHKLVRKIRRHPGITLSDLKSEKHGTMMHVALELQMLEAAGLIRSIRDGLRQRFYCLTSDDQCNSPAQGLRRSIVLLVQQKPGINEAQIARSLGTSQQLTNYHLRLLVDAKLLHRVLDHGNVSYFMKQQVATGRDNCGLN